MMKKAHPGIGYFQFLLKNTVINRHSALFEGTADGVIKLFKSDRLGQIIVRTLAQTIKSNFNIRGPGDHDNTEIRISRNNIFQYLITILIGKSDIEQNNSDLFPGYKVEKFVCASGTDNFKSLIPKIMRQQKDNFR